MSLRSRLIGAFMVLVSLPLVVGVTSFVLSQRIDTEVADLRARHGVDLRSVDLHNTGLELEGYWDDGSFVATDVQVLAGPRQPKVRGAIQRVDRKAGTITLYGIPIRVEPSVQVLDGDGDGTHASLLDALRPGHRVEVSCKVVDGVWRARKIKTVAVKASDKVKGTPTGYDLDGVAPETVTIHGLVVVLAPVRDAAPRSALQRIKMATRMVLALQECRAVARAMLRNGADATDPGAARSEATLRPDDDRDEGLAAQERLAMALRDFAHWLQQARDAHPGVDDASRWLLPLIERQGTLVANVEALQRLAHDDPERARLLLDRTLDPLVENELLPPLHAYLQDAEETLGYQLRSISSRTATAARIALIASAVAVVLAVVLAVHLWRAIHRPVQALHRAALQLGRGDLDTRVDLGTRDELGDLACAFNEMAEELAATTVSIHNLEAVERQLRRSLAEKEVLLRDVHHRVKNNMQVISSLLAMQIGSSTDSEARALFEQSHARIRSMALIHEQLYRAPDLTRIDLDGYLRVLATALSQSLGMAGRVEIALEVDDVQLDIDQSMAIGLIVTELVTNALRHAFSSGASGVVRISLHESPPGHEGECVLTVADDGQGISPSFDAAASGTLGIRLVETLARQLGGTATVRGEHGTEVTVVFPLRQPASEEVA